MSNSIPVSDRANVGVSLVSGQIVAADNYRLKPIPLSDDGESVIRAQMKFKRSRPDVKEDKV